MIPDRALAVRLGYDGLVPLRDRIRYVSGIRLLVVAALIARSITASSPSTLERVVPIGFAVFAVLALSLVVVKDRARMLTLFTGSLLIDGVFLAAATYGTSRFESPLAMLVIVHVLVCTLLGSFRTGLKIALWHTLLIASTFQYLEALEGDAGHDMRHAAIGLATMVWVAAITTATLASLNERELRRRNLDLQDLADLALAMESCTTSAQVGEQLLGSALGVLPVDRAFVALIEQECPVVIAGHGTLGTPVATSSELDALGRATQTRTTQRIARVHSDDDPWLASLVPSAQNVLVIPMHAEGRAVGVLVMEYGPRRSARVEQRAVTILERLVAHSGLSLENMRLLSQVRAQAMTDGLTELANRRQFDEVAAEAFDLATTSAAPMSLILLDIDRFKDLNDRYGHQVGDETLRRIGTLLRAGVRPGDTAARYGGEEFAIVLPRTEPREALALAEKLREAIATWPMSPSVTASLGVATATSGDTGTGSVLERADLALYDAKRGGRNRVAVAQPDARRDAESGITITEPTVTGPAVAEPAMSEPALTEPVMTEPGVTEPIGAV